MFSWLIRLIGDYLRLVLFAAAVIVGMQVPSFIEQYGQRVNAHLLEAQQNLAGFQFTADRYFNGDLQKLIDYYRLSNDPVFRQDAQSIESIYRRVLMLTNESRAMAQPIVQRALHVVLYAKPELRQETFDAYAYSVPLSTVALIWGAVLAFSLALLLDGCVACGKYCSRKLFHRHHAHH